MRFRYNAVAAAAARASNAKSSPASKITSLTSLPDELLLEIFGELDIVTLLSLCNVSKRFHALSKECLVKRMRDDPCIRLRLHFRQEHKWKRRAEMVFSDFDPKTDTLIFRPVPTESSGMRLFQSATLRKPNLWKVCLSRDQNGKAEELVAHGIDENFISNSRPLFIKHHGELHLEDTVNRKGHGATHLPVDYSLTYKVGSIPEGIPKVRSGERWVSPVEFACPLAFFYPHESTFRKIMSAFRKRGGPIKRRSTLKKRQGLRAAQGKEVLIDASQTSSSIQP